MSVLRIILQVEHDEIQLAARAAARVSNPAYDWPRDGLALIGYVGVVTTTTFCCKRNKNSITVWSQRPRDA